MTDPQPTLPGVNLGKRKRPPRPPDEAWDAWVSVWGLKEPIADRALQNKYVRDLAKKGLTLAEATKRKALLLATWGEKCCTPATLWSKWDWLGTSNPTPTYGCSPGDAERMEAERREFFNKREESLAARRVWLESQTDDELVVWRDKMLANRQLPAKVTAAWAKCDPRTHDVLAGQVWLYATGGLRDEG